MTYLLDANTCVRYLNGQSASIRRHVESTKAEELALCSIVKAELLYGAFKSGRPEANLATLARFFSGFVSLPCDDAAANDATLVTHNTVEFSRVPHLQLDDWE